MTSAPSTSLAVPKPPSPLECTLLELPAGSVVHRIHDQRFTWCEFNPGLGASRFAPFEVLGTAVPTAYAASSLDCAVFETLFHDIDATEPFKAVRWSLVEKLSWSVVELVRPVRLAQLFSADLMRWGLERTHLIDTPKSTYGDTRTWSPAIHETIPPPDGMVWTSRRFDQERAMILFGSRITTADLRLVETVKASSDRTFLEATHALAARAGITITR